MASDPVFDDPEDHLEALGVRFLRALEARRRDDVDMAADLLRGILSVEPRLAEPRLELGSLLLAAGHFAEAEEQLTEAIRLFETGSYWVEDVPLQVALSLAYDTLGEVYRQLADTDQIVFGPPDRWKELMDRARQAFTKARDLDPENEHAAAWALPRPKGEVEPSDGDEPHEDPSLEDPSLEDPSLEDDIETPLVVGPTAEA